MKQYIENLKSGTTPFVIRLRFIFLISVTCLVLLHALHTFKSGFLPLLAMQIGEIILGLICIVSGILIAIKDPAMTFKMFGGVFAAIYIMTIVDYLLQ